MDAVKIIDLTTTCCTKFRLSHIILRTATPLKCKKMSEGSYNKFWGLISQNPRNRNLSYLRSGEAGVNAIVIKNLIEIYRPDLTIRGLEFFWLKILVPHNLKTIWDRTAVFRLSSQTPTVYNIMLRKRQKSYGEKIFFSDPHFPPNASP
jgi:hypothetical protein